MNSHLEQLEYTESSQKHVPVVCALLLGGWVLTEGLCFEQGTTKQGNEWTAPKINKHTKETEGYWLELRGKQDQLHSILRPTEAEEYQQNQKQNNITNVRPPVVRHENCPAVPKKKKVHADHQNSRPFHIEELLNKAKSMMGDGPPVTTENRWRRSEPRRIPTAETLSRQNKIRRAACP